ncbi:hypothetical protein [Kitasatospora sp. NPDC057223]|uniref:hypothetical protein n=1 Tax=Kitasatospora sp. NPDC057223 TaxID=3346055 RepID=UPI00363F5E20
MVRTAARTAGGPTAACRTRAGSGGQGRTAAAVLLATTKRRHVDYRRATSTAC